MEQRKQTMAEIFNQGFALVVGVGADLPNTVNDAKGLANILKDKARCAYPQQQVNLLVNQAATRQNILSGLDKLAQTSNPDATAVIYFSGHGGKVDSTYYLIPHNFNPLEFQQTVISGEEFADKLRAMPAKKLLILLDCYHAGGVGDAKVPGLQLTKAPLPPEALNFPQEGRGRVLIASCKEDEVSFTGKPYSAFTQALIEALCGQGVAKKDGYVRVSDLALHCREMVPQKTKDQQHPILHWEESDNFVVAYYASGEKEPKLLPDELMQVQNPVTETEPKTETKYNQSGQTVENQINVEGGIHGSTFNFPGSDKKKD